jgi:hypothetical protein
MTGGSRLLALAVLATMLAVSTARGAETFDPENPVPAPAGSDVIHDGGKVHDDGAKNDETIIQVWGMGPATSTPAEKR